MRCYNVQEPRALSAETSLQTIGERLNTGRSHATRERTLDMQPEICPRYANKAPNLQQTQRGTSRPRRVQAMPNTHLLRQPGGLIMQHRVFSGSDTVAHMRAYTCSSRPQPVSLTHTQGLSPTVWHTHRTRWPGREAEAGASRQLALSGRSSSSLWRKGGGDGYHGSRYPKPL